MNTKKITDNTKSKSNIRKFILKGALILIVALLINVESPVGFPVYFSIGRYTFGLSSWVREHQPIYESYKGAALLEGGACEDRRITRFAWFVKITIISH